MRGTEARPPEWDWIFAMDKIDGPHRSMADLARQRNTHPVELMIDMALERDMKFFMMQPVANENQSEALELMKHPRSVVTFSDAGAHISQIMDQSLQTHLLGYWVRERQVFSPHPQRDAGGPDVQRPPNVFDRGGERRRGAIRKLLFSPHGRSPFARSVASQG